jgi:hypothetical protein
MSIKFLCSHCGHKLKALPSQAGKSCKCTRCGEMLGIPHASLRRKPARLLLASFPRRRVLVLAGSVAAALLLAIASFLFLFRPDDTQRSLSDLKNGDAQVRARAVALLAETNPVDIYRGQVTAALEPLLSDADRGVNHELVLRAYLRWADRDNVPALIGLLDNPPPHDWQPKDSGAVMEKLGKLQDPRAIGFLAEKLADPRLHDQAVYALKLQGPRAAVTVLDYLFDGDAGTRARAEQFLASYGMPPRTIAAEALTRLRSSQPEVQQSAAAWFADNAPADDAQKADGSALLAGMLDSLSPQVNALALRGLKLWATPESLPQLTAFAVRLQKAAANPDVAASRTMLLDVLAQIPDQRAADAVALELKDPTQRAQAVQALLKFGPVASGAVLGYLNHPDPALQKEARSLARMLNIPVDRLLDQILADLAAPSRPRNVAALQQLAKLRPDEANRPRVARALNSLLLDADLSVRTAALDAAQIWGSKENLDALVKNLQTLPSGNPQQNGRLIAQATGMLIALGPDVEPKVLPLIDSLDPVVRSQACLILAEVGTSRSVEPLLHTAQFYAGTDVNFYGQLQFAIQRIKGRG